MEAVISNYWDLLPEELHQEVFYQEHKLGMSKVMAELTREHEAAKQRRVDHAVKVVIKDLHNKISDGGLEQLRADMYVSAAERIDDFVVIKGKCYIYNIETNHEEGEECENRCHISCMTQQTSSYLLVKEFETDSYHTKTIDDDHSSIRYMIRIREKFYGGAQR